MSQPFPPNLQNNFTPDQKSLKAQSLRERSHHPTCHMSRVTCHMSKLIFCVNYIHVFLLIINIFQQIDVARHAGVLGVYEFGKITV